MFVAEKKKKNQWEQLADVTFEEDKTYFIVNNSTDIIYAVEGSAAPADTIIGIPVLPTNYIKYEKGSQNLYFRNRKQPTTDLAGNTKIEYSTVLVNSVDTDDTNGTDSTDNEVAE